MLDLKIELLELNFENAAGQEHRIQPIAARAASILAERLDESWAEGKWEADALHMESLSAPPLSLNLHQASDEEAATEIARAWLDALAIHLEV